jgi:glycosyltransferase involved in cell wall biosynthesis
LKDDFKPTVSVIIPLYNREKLIERAIDSVLKQSYSDFELIVVDDCSTDNSAKVVQNIDDPRIIYIKHDVNKGANTARNTGIKLAKGEYIAFQDSDDEWLPGKLEKQMALIVESPSKVGIVYSGFWRIQDKQKTFYPYEWIKKLEGDISNEVLKTSFISTQTLLVKKSCFNHIGLFDETLPRLQDWDMVIRLSETYEFSYIPEGLVYVYHTDNSITANHNIYAAAFDQIIQKHYKLFSKNKKNLSKQYCATGTYFFKHQDSIQAKKYFIKAISISPVNVKCILKFCLLLLKMVKS